AFTAEDGLQLLIIRKRYEPAAGYEKPIALYGQESEVVKSVLGEDPHAPLQTLIPDDLAFDFAMNIFTFDPGHGLPIVETHVMEHGLYFLEGKGLYYTAHRWLA